MAESIITSTSWERARRASICPLDQQLAAPNFAQFVITAHNVKDRESSSPFWMASSTRISPQPETRITRLVRMAVPVGFPLQFSASPVPRSARFAIGQSELPR